MSDLKLRRLRLTLGRISGQLGRLGGELEALWLRLRLLLLWREPRELRLKLSSTGEPRGLGLQLRASESSILRRISGRLRNEARWLWLLRLWLLLTGELGVWLL